LPEPLQLYPKAIRVTSFGDLFPLAPQTPLDPEFSCADFSLEHQIFDDPEHGGTVPLSAHSAFLGVHTERAESCLEETLRQEAITLGGLNPAAYFTIETHRVDSVYLPGTPTDTCAIFRSGSAGPGERELLTAGAPLPYGEPPAVCAATPCVAELAGFSGDTPSESTADTAHAAAYWGFNEVRSLYPRVRWNCDDHECLNLQILDEGVNVLGRGSLTVPLNFLLGSAVTLRYSDTGAKESTPAQ
jgi:hypothetical protein